MRLFAPRIRSPSFGETKLGAGTGTVVGIRVGTRVLPGVRGGVRVTVRVAVGELVGIGVSVGGRGVAVCVGRNVAVEGGRVATRITVTGICVCVGVRVAVACNAMLAGSTALT